MGRKCVLCRTDFSSEVRAKTAASHLRAHHPAALSRRPLPPGQPVTSPRRPLPPGQVTKALRSRRAILRKVEGEEARDEQYEAMLRSMAPGHRLLPENAAAEAAPLQQQARRGSGALAALQSSAAAGFSSAAAGFSSSSNSCASS